MSQNYYTRIENLLEVRKKILFLLFVVVTRTINKERTRYGLVWAVMVNPLEMAINNETRNKTLCKLRCATVL